MKDPFSDSSKGDGALSFAQALDAAGKIRFAMAVTHADALEARPLTTQAVESEGVLWFFVSASGEFARDAARAPQLLLLYADPGESRYLSVAGMATLLTDTERARRLWSPLAATFFPGGPDDADLRLLRVDVTKVEAWEPHGSRIGQFLKLAAAAMGANIKPEDIGRHQTATPPR